ncbi:hypothetical protein ACFPM0_29185 [Pseudonocardia sulfidoxydans]|uniref:hypothetical protein n=1 Tax=Pseudonocardia sulfidoxydans TaxID=54011 RepID=UPI00361466FE
MPAWPHRVTGWGRDGLSRVRGTAVHDGTGETSMTIGSARREIGDVRQSGTGAIPGPRTAADAYRVSDDQVHKARLVVAENSEGPEDLRLLLDMLGLISTNSDDPPPVSR